MILVDKYRDTISGTVMTLLAAGYLAGSFQIRSYGDAAVDSRFFPQILGVMLLVLSITQLILGVKKLKAGTGTEETAEAAPAGEAPGRFNYKVILTLAVILAYIVLINRLGFVISSSLFLIAQTRIMAERKTWRPLFTILVSVVFSYVINRIFVDGFSLILPEGELIERFFLGGE